MKVKLNPIFLKRILTIIYRIITTLFAYNVDALIWLSTKSVDKPVITLSQTHPVARQFWAGVKLIKNWSENFQQNLQHPETVDEAVERLMMILDGEQKLAIAVMPKEDLINLHFGLGMEIRNAFGLHEQGSKLLASCNNNELYNSVHPDDASEMVIQALWRSLQT